MHKSKLGFVVKWQAGGWDSGWVLLGSSAGDTDPYFSSELRMLTAVEGGDEARDDLGAGSVHPGAKVTSRDASLQAQGSWCRKGEP